VAHLVCIEHIDERGTRIESCRPRVLIFLLLLFVVVVVVATFNFGLVSLLLL
jgi:hypothetical protein